MKTESALLLLPLGLFIADRLAGRLTANNAHFLRRTQTRAFCAACLPLAPFKVESYRESPVATLPQPRAAKCEIKSRSNPRRRILSSWIPGGVLIRFGWGGRRGGVVGERRGRVIYFNLNWSGKLKRKGFFFLEIFWKQSQLGIDSFEVGEEEEFVSLI